MLIQTIITLLIIGGILAFFVKIYFQIIIKDPTKKGKYYFVVLRLIYITDFLPMRIRYKQGEELQLRKKANRALVTFYACMALIAILIAIFL